MRAAVGVVGAVNMCARVACTGGGMRIAYHRVSSTFGHLAVVFRFPLIPLYFSHACVYSTTNGTVRSSTHLRLVDTSSTHDFSGLLYRERWTPFGITCRGSLLLILALNLSQCPPCPLRHLATYIHTYKVAHTPTPQVSCCYTGLFPARPCAKEERPSTRRGRQRKGGRRGETCRDVFSLSARGIRRGMCGGACEVAFAQQQGTRTTIGTAPNTYPSCDYTHPSIHTHTLHSCQSTYLDPHTHTPFMPRHPSTHTHTHSIHAKARTSIPGDRHELLGGEERGQRGVLQIEHTPIPRPGKGDQFEAPRLDASLQRR